MVKLPKRRRGIGTVITTLIILIASVALAAGVVFFGGSMFETSAKFESIKTYNSHVWTSSTGPSVAAFVVQNTGDTAVSVQQITLRGQAVPFTSWYYNNTASVATTENVMKELRFDSSLTGIDVSGDLAEEQFSQASGAITLEQGQAMFVYLENPAGISMLDAGFDVSLGVHAGKSVATEMVHVTTI
ncbi:MAG TPA: hypothetical protein VJL54_02330 [Nitrososphaera sp.]|nr:hypothetical protein [Nitrososphaera sp.]